MLTTYEEMRAQYKSDEQLARILFSMLAIQEHKLEKAEQQLAKPAQFERRENRG